MINENEKKRRELNQSIFLTILEPLQCFACLGLAVRGDDDNKSKFIQLLRPQSKKFTELTDWLSKKTERYISPDVQNEIINLMSNQIMRNLIEPVRICNFSVKCDEYTDVSNKEQLTFCMRWVNNDLEVSEKFLRFYEIPDKKSSTIVTVIKDILLRYQLNLDISMTVLTVCWENRPVLPLRFLQNN